MVHAYQRSRFGQAVSLNDGVAEPGPELLGRRRQCRPSGNDRPEFPPETPPDFPEAPPAPEEMLPFGLAKSPSERLCLPARAEIALDLVAQRFDQPRNRDEHGHFFVVNRDRKSTRLNSSH